LKGEGSGIFVMLLPKLEFKIKSNYFLPGKC